MRITPITKVAVVGLAAALALTACSNSKKDSTTTTASKTYKIGFEGPLSGDNAQLGINEVNAVDLAVEQANAKSDLGFKLELVKSDDVGDPAKAPAAAAVLQQDAAILGVIGPSFSGATKAVGASYDAAGLVLISPSATNPALTTLGFKSFHRVVPPDSLEGQEAGDYLVKKSKKVFVVDDLSDYGKGAADAVETAVKAGGGTVTRQGVDAKTTDYSVIATAVAASGAGALFYGGYDTQAGQFAKALKTAGYTGLTMTGNGGKSSKFTTAAGAAGDGWYFSCGCLDATVAPQAKDFNTAYKAKFNTDPSTYSPEAYDATNALISAISTSAKSGTATRAAVFSAVNELDYKGITTQIKFLPSGEVSAQVINLYQQKAGAIGLLGDIKTAS
ncbi:amino acid/amide ABC transporter substrate-binding protein (HAAT family) [Jatrophihabitans sp. GAS493]|uniref:branched-chain amino acid ABC transporter substrate-binding protein n=1 Tax=Jatrophihabitans sp. GAS493 TaxID=1907575 RepID=UPI000BBF567F|nr:branched-chain amino acid ABC transporter substrate-binding protein [Jatrophihabitans sp. GAS493]SOD73447.1 amino acid/amide ABC transporter substrate-binding protein (HAAT family) [Jatrophihabitans sp. GAS493]